MATVNGGSSSDTISGGSGNDSLSGNDGNDSIQGNGGNDTIRGGTGHDTLRGGDDQDSMDGGAGDDQMYGDAGNDSMSGGDGYDQMYGGNGDDTISGDGSYDDIYAGSGDDSVSGGDGDDWIWGEDGNDTISGGAGNDSAFGGEGHDSIDGGSGNDTIHGEGGNDNIQGGSGSDFVDGGDGDDSISGGDDSDIVVGGRGDDTIKGDDGDDIVSGHAGDDALYGGAGNDSLYGGSGDDYFDGGAGDDQINMSRTAGNGTYTNEGSKTDNDVVRLHSGSGHDVAHDFQGEDDYIYIGSIDKSDIVFKQTGPSIWVLTQSGGSPDDSLTINFAPGTEPDSEGDLRNQLVDDSEYTPPENGNSSSLNPACFTPQSHVLTPNGMRRIGGLRAGDVVSTADNGPQPIRDVLRSRYQPDDLKNVAAFRPVVIEKGAFGRGLPNRRMHVSRQHAFLIERGTGLVRAVHLAEHFQMARIQNNRPNGICYIHLLMDAHQLLNVDGVWTESFYASPNGEVMDILNNRSIITHHARCRPLLKRADLRKTRPNGDDIGRLPNQSAPNTLGDVATASAPICVNP